MNLVNAQQARRVLDRLVGYELSPVISRKVKGAMSAGRVQSVALKMIVEREREIRNFKPEEYWNIYAFLLQQGKNAVFKCEFVDVDGKKYKVKNKDAADKIVKASKEGEWVVDKVKRVNSQSKPQPPFTTSTMQQDASGKLSLTAPQVMQLAQQLYEGVELGSEGQVALVTYIRTDSVRISDDAQREALSYIRSNYGDDYCPKRPNVYETKKGAQDAHEAIRPISLERTPESIKDKVPRNIYKLYKGIPADIRSRAELSCSKAIWRLIHPFRTTKRKRTARLCRISERDNPLRSKKCRASRNLPSLRSDLPIQRWSRQWKKTA